MNSPNIWRYIEDKRFMEALYFGALELAIQPTPELHLALGVACCAAISPVAEFQRTTATANTETRITNRRNKIEPSSAHSTVINQLSRTMINNCVVKRNTRLVNEGLHHLLQSIRQDPQIQFPITWFPIVQQILQDLHDYCESGLKDVVFSDLSYSAADAAKAAMVLIDQLQNKSSKLRNLLYEFQIEAYEELLTKLSVDPEDQAVFYRVISE